VASSVLRVCQTSRARASLAYVLRLPNAARHAIGAGEHGTSRFSPEMFPCMLRFSDRARSPYLLPYRGMGCRLPHTETASAPRTSMMSRLNSPPARAPVNASRAPYGRPPMTRGRCDWLGLHRTTLAFAPPHRFIPALPPLLLTPLRHARFARKPSRRHGSFSSTPRGQRTRASAAKLVMGSSHFESVDLEPGLARVALERQRRAGGPSGM
jgi:hypothetical protein